MGKVETHSQPEVLCAEEERAGGSAMAGQVRGGKEEGKGSFLLAENPKKQNSSLWERGRLIPYLAHGRCFRNALGMKVKSNIPFSVKPFPCPPAYRIASLLLQPILRSELAVISAPNTFYFCFNLFISWGAEGEGERVTSRLCAKWGAQCKAPSHDLEIMT